MSDFVRALNLIKTRRDPAWLTPSQQEALGMLQKALQVLSTINLFGSAGVGKTFLAWNLAEILGYAYFPHICSLQQSEHLSEVGVIVDNCRPERQAHRDILKVLSFRGVRRSILISRQLVRDYTHYVELKLTADDLAKVRQNLIALGLYQGTIEVPNLWYLLNQHL